ncbi:hypothetical protein LZ198_09650 [Myxococcus sp. K15C18031901]|uniref:hypothetical protein n=1 Tax=Myxococcus dinghuensis TaxID=2906761 RepID=UPI0020A7AC93|nr:hypothetical protein [Myxococcus dinghuensis]MCP3099131.1 hypothetical protein [Myxococcus dinghuensis]
MTEQWQKRLRTRRCTAIAGHELISLAQALRPFTWDQRRAAVASDAPGFADAFNREHRLGMRVEPGGLAASLLVDKGLGDPLRPPVFDGRTLAYQVLAVPGLDAPVPPTGRVGRLLAVEVDVAEGRVRHAELARYVEPPRAR